MRIASVVFGISLLLCGAVLAGPLGGEVAFSGGATFPQGDLSAYSDPGPNFTLRGVFNPSNTSPFGLLVDLNLALFESETEEFTDDIGGTFYRFERNVSQYAVAFHGGAQFAPALQGTGFRPRLAAAPGLYVFNTETSVKFKDDDEDIDSDSDSMVKFGVRGVVGIDMAFSPKWALGFEFAYDRVFGMETKTAVDTTGSIVNEDIDAEYNTFMVTVTIPFSTFNGE